MGQVHSLRSATPRRRPRCAPPTRPVARGHTQKVSVRQGHPRLSVHPVCSLGTQESCAFSQAHHTCPRGVSRGLPQGVPASALRPPPRRCHALCLAQEGGAPPYLSTESRPLQAPEAPLAQDPGARLLRPEAAGSLPPVLGLGPRILLGTVSPAARWLRCPRCHLKPGVKVRTLNKLPLNVRDV